MLLLAFVLVLAKIACLGWTMRMYRRQRRGMHLAVCILAALSLPTRCAWNRYGGGPCRVPLGEPFCLAQLSGGEECDLAVRGLLSLV
jgi:hypothetical protein